MVLEISITLFGKLNVFLNHNENQIAIREREKIHYAILIGRKLSEKKNSFDLHSFTHLSSAHKKERD